MVQILVAAVDFGNFPSRFARIATLYPTKRIAFSGANLRDIKPRSLEQSTVDIAREFANMIITQRAFSSASTVITTADEMLQELVQIKR